MCQIYSVTPVTSSQFSVPFCHICQFTASSGVRFFCFFTLFTSFPLRNNNEFLIS